MRVGVLWRLRDSLLQDIDGSSGIAAADRCAPLIDERCLCGKKDGGERREDNERKAHMSYDADSHLLLL
jgi:hypothetical protein